MRRVSSKVRLRAAVLALLILLVSAVAVHADDTPLPPPPDAKIQPPGELAPQGFGQPTFLQLLLIGLGLWPEIQPLIA